MKYLNLFDDKSALDSSVTSITHGDGAFVFGVDTSQGVEDVTIYDQRHPGANCPEVYNAYPVNMEPVKLDSSSNKRTPAVGDILYATVDGKLTLDTQTNINGAVIRNTPIAICVIPGVIENFKNGDNSAGAVRTARFVSIDYMNYTTPTTGNTDAQGIIFGNQGTTIGNVKGEMGATSYIGGKWNTQKCLHACTKEKNDLTGGVTNNSGLGYCAPACCCVAYSTKGTKPGDWYLPAIGELYQICKKENKATINKARNAIKGSGFSENSYWSSKEGESAYEVSVNFEQNAVESNDRSHNCFVLAFLALEV